MPKITQKTWDEFVNISKLKGKEILTKFEDYNSNNDLHIKCIECNNVFTRNINMFKKYDYRCPLHEYTKSSENGNLKGTNEQFIKRSIEIHGDKYDYSQVEYISNLTPVKIICKEHGLFEQRPAKHWAGQGCIHCGNIKKRNMYLMTNEEFIKKAVEIHNNKFIYIEPYIDSKTKIKIKCKECDHEFQQNPSSHLSKHGCPICEAKNGGLVKRLNQEDVIERAKKIHGDKYDYSKVKYTTTYSKIEVFCNGCKSYFWCTPHNHIYSESGCPNCAKMFSKEEMEVFEYIKSIYNGEIESGNRTQISPHHLDIYLPKLKYAIEYNGLFWHSEELKKKEYHRNKTINCLNKGISLFHIFSDEWRHKSDIIKSMISYRIGLVTTKIHARKTEIMILSKEEGEDFFNKSHISGNTRASIYIGLKYNNCIVAAISFRKPIQKKYGEQTIEIARFANSLNTIVNGGFQKLLKYSEEYLKKQQINKILTYADLRFGEGKVYEKAGFLYEGHTEVDYWYTDNLERYHRFKFRADPEKGLTEAQVAEAAGVHKIYGCGSNIYTKELL